MSVATSALRAPSRAPAAAPRPAPRPPAPRLRVVRAPARTRTRAPFVMLCMSVLAGSLLGALLLNTAMAQGAYQRFDLNTRLAESARQQQLIESQLEQAAAPAQLSAAARGLGMVPSASAGYLRLTDGAVLGSPVPAGAGR